MSLTDKKNYTMFTISHAFTPTLNNSNTTKYCFIFGMCTLKKEALNHTDVRDVLRSSELSR